jgi:hypothetical protein
MNSVFEGAGLELLLVVDDHHRILVVVVVLKTRHSDGSLSVFSILPKSIRLGVFLQPQRLAQLRSKLASFLEQKALQFAESDCSFLLDFISSILQLLVNL